MSTFTSIPPLWFRESAYGYRQHFALMDRSTELFEQHGTVDAAHNRLVVITGANILHASLYAGYIAAMNGNDVSLDVKTPEQLIPGMPLSGSSRQLDTEQQAELLSLFTNVDTLEIQKAFCRTLDGVDLMRVGVCALQLADQR